MSNPALPAVTVPASDTPPARLIADLARLVTLGDRATALRLLQAG